jgi:hypothetical protein
LNIILNELKLELELTRVLNEPSLNTHFVGIIYIDKKKRTKKKKKEKKEEARR